MRKRLLQKLKHLRKKKQKVSNHDNQKRVCIGKIAGAHGVKGLVKIKPFCDELRLLNGTLYTNETGDETINITLKNNVGKYTLAQVDEITTREQAEVTKFLLYIRRDQLPETGDDEFYIEDLTGITAYEGDKQLGKIIAANDFGAGTLLEIKPNSGESYFVPFDDQYIQSINLEEKTIHLDGVERFKL